MSGPLSGIRVVEFAPLVAGPVAGMCLADQGADVVKVQPLGVDDSHPPDPIWVDSHNIYYHALNRNKRAVALNLRMPEGRAILIDLIRKTDVIIIAIRPQTIAQLRITYEEVKSGINPRIIYAQITGWGLKGPLVDRPGYDFLVQARIGLLSKRKAADGSPVGTGILPSDNTTGLLTAYGIGLALFKRAETGKGEKIDQSLLSGGLAAQANTVVKVVGSPETTRDLLAARNTAEVAPYRCSDGEWIFLSCNAEREWERLLAAIGMPRLINDPLCNSRAARGKNKDMLYELLTGVFSTRPVADWLTILENADVPCAPVLSQEQIFGQEQLWENGYLERWELPEGKQMIFMASPVRLASYSSKIKSLGPRFGQDTDAILKDLGYHKEMIQALEAKRVIFCEKQT